VTALAREYSNEIYRIAEEEVNDKKTEIDVNCGNTWVEAANSCGCPVPTEQEQKVLEIIKESVVDKIENGIEPEKVILTAIDKKFGKYPKNKASVSKCVKLFS
jgi:hypothetical protein